MFVILTAFEYYAAVSLIICLVWAAIGFVRKKHFWVQCAMWRGVVFPGMEDGLCIMNGMNLSNAATVPYDDHTMGVKV